jgi:hypothetical protein
MRDMKKELMIGIVVLIVIVVLGFWFFPKNTVAPVTQADVILDAPITVVTSPLTITGTARGNWFFEASFPIIIKDADGSVLAQGHAQATDDWMTTDYVPFTATVTFTKPKTATGMLILKNDNPSGDPVNDKMMTIPVTFQ